MRRTDEPLLDKDQTAQAMYSLVRKYAHDLDSVMVRRGGKLVPLSQLTMRQMFHLLRRIPYRRDNVPVEVVARPKYIMQYAGLGMDCKKKAQAMGAWLHRNGYKPMTGYRFVASSRRPDGKVHHVFPQARVNGRWQNLDATYRHYRPFSHKRVTFAEVLEP